jgi:malonyl-CoA/methylmalonyl-CoA synthetase
MSGNLFDLLVPQKPANRIAIIDEAGATTTYGELDRQSAALAARLAAAGLAPGERIAVQAEKSVTAMVLYLAVLRAGGVYLPLNTAYTPAELRYFLEDARPVLFVHDPRHSHTLAPLAQAAGAATAALDPAGQLVLSGTEHAAAPFATVSRADDDLAAILYTSGTTGRSKGAMLTHGNLASNASTLAEAWRYSANDELLHALPIYHTHGLFVASNVTLLSGARMRLLPRFDVEVVLRHLRTATVMMGVPTFYTRLLADGRLDREVTAGMRLFVSGSAPLLAETHRAWLEATGHRILERYGMTETNMNCSNPYEGERRPGTVGPPLPGIEARIVDPESGAELPRGEIGMIEVRGPNVFKGYWNMPEKTAAEFRDDCFFITGDLGRMSEDDYVEIVGRGKDLVITGGLNVYPKEVETAIDAIEGVEESAVIGLPDDDLGEAVAAVVVRKAGATLSPEHIKEELRGQLAGFKLPKRIVFVDELPRNTMGKVQKNILRNTLQ